MNILIVDDEHILLKFMEKRIKELMPKAVIASFDNCQDAINYAENNIINIAFLDIHMSGITGLELAESLKQTFPKINIIFTTGYDSFAIEAFKMNASGYIMKPVTKESIQKELNNLRYPVEETIQKRITFQCFGNFEAFVDSKPIEFKFSKTKELLAYLVYKRGALCSNEEIIGVLWEDFNDHTSYFKQLRQDLDIALCNLDCENILVRQRGKMGINTQFVECDYYNYLNGSTPTVNEFMSQYSWGENVTALLDKN
ncbi:MAG: response regulator [Treponema sp.]|nr:response regulator [Treponema sp.]